MKVKHGISIKYSRKAAFIAPLILAATLQAGVITDWTSDRLLSSGHGGCGEAGGDG